jgi:hypothetical protein
VQPEFDISGAIHIHGLLYSLSLPPFSNIGDDALQKI